VQESFDHFWGLPGSINRLAGIQRPSQPLGAKNMVASA
jgi:hypothetical protein